MQTDQIILTPINMYPSPASHNKRRQRETDLNPRMPHSASSCVPIQHYSFDKVPPAGNNPRIEKIYTLSMEFRKAQKGAGCLGKVIQKIES